MRIVASELCVTLLQVTNRLDELFHRHWLVVFSQVSLQGKSVSKEQGNGLVVYLSSEPSLIYENIGVCANPRHRTGDVGVNHIHLLASLRIQGKQHQTASVRH